MGSLGAKISSVPSPPQEVCRLLPKSRSVGEDFPFDGRLFQRLGGGHSRKGSFPGPRRPEFLAGGQLSSPFCSTGGVSQSRWGETVPQLPWPHATKGFKEEWPWNWSWKQTGSRDSWRENGATRAIQRAPRTNRAAAFCSQR